MKIESKYIERIGRDKVQEVIAYWYDYFRMYKFYDMHKNMFVHKKDESRTNDFVYINILIHHAKVNGLLK